MDFEYFTPFKLKVQMSGNLKHPRVELLTFNTAPSFNVDSGNLLIFAIYLVKVFVLEVLVKLFKRFMFKYIR